MTGANGFVGSADSLTFKLGNKSRSRKSGQGGKWNFYHPNIWICCLFLAGAKKRGPLQDVPVMARAIADRLGYAVPSLR
jgi:hypothetical protein